jgi:tRNA-2-methylthio-N6-dimethylallyladenosine synthase
MTEQNRAKLLYLETFGCQMNVNDSEKMTALMADLGYGVTTDPSQADMILLNTCSIRAKAEQKVYDIVRNYKPLKRLRPHLIIGVGGCVAQQEGERLLKRLPLLDLVVGTHAIHRLPQLVRSAEAGERRVETEFRDSDTAADLFLRGGVTGKVNRFVTVMQGCDNFCSYCIVPHVRGREMSRQATDIVAEIRELADAGVREVTLLGQNVNSYGRTFGDGNDFATLLRQVATIDGIERIRFTTSHPRDLSPALIACFAEIKSLCGHMHLPAQAGNDRVLEAMNRGYRRYDYLQRVAELRRARPDIQLTTDVIVGFPGESDGEFRDTLSLLEEVRYADLFSFVYSARPGTQAALLTEELTYRQKVERLDQVNALQYRISFEINQGFVGSRERILVEGVSKRGDQLFGRTEGNRIVNFPGESTLIGQFVEVSIVRAYPNSLLGVLHAS